MRAGFVDTMHDMHHRQDAPDPVQAPVETQDVTLGMTALLGIFVAVILVCAVFFGFGYSTGRTLHGAATPASSPTPTSNVAGGEAARSVTPAPALAPAPALVKPSPAAALPNALPEDAAPIEPSTIAAEPQREAPATRPQARLADSAAPPTQAASINSGVMVQIAAVARQGDADALAHALRGNGYSAVVRTEPQDAFLHVQVGPFATRDAARAMRARLQANGYNAFIKP